MACPLAVPCLAGQFKSLTRIRNSVVLKNKRKNVETQQNLKT